MNPSIDAEQRALQIIQQAGGDSASAQWMLGVLRQAGLPLLDRNANEFVCRWVDVQNVPVPPDADTIIRTITTTTDGYSTSRTHWLEGLEPPPK